nr:p13 [Blackcurrant leafroll-associated virus 1]
MAYTSIEFEDYIKRKKDQLGRCLEHSNITTSLGLHEAVMKFNELLLITSNCAVQTSQLRKWSSSSDRLEDIRIMSFNSTLKEVVGFLKYAERIIESHPRMCDYQRVPTRYFQIPVGKVSISDA